MSDANWCLQPDAVPDSRLQACWAGSTPPARGRMPSPRLGPTPPQAPARATGHSATTTTAPSPLLPAVPSRRPARCSAPRPVVVPSEHRGSTPLSGPMDGARQRAATRRCSRCRPTLLPAMTPSTGLETLARSGRTTGAPEKGRSLCTHWHPTPAPEMVLSGCRGITRRSAGTTGAPGKGHQRCSH